MELCSKLTLRDWMVNPERIIDLPQCIDLLSQLLQGLKYIHNLGYVLLIINHIYLIFIAHSI